MVRHVKIPVKQRPCLRPVCEKPYSQGVRAVSRIMPGGPFCYRYRLQDEGLLASIKAVGMLMPLIVTSGERPIVVVGHKRLHAAKVLRMKHVPVLIAEKMEPGDFFLLNLVSNWRQGCSEMDRARALGMAIQEFQFAENEVLSKVMPLLGLLEDKLTLELYRKADRCVSSFKDFVEDGQLSLRSLASFLKFSQKDQDYFAKNIGARVKLTSSQLAQSGEWLSDIIKGTGKCLRALCKEHRLFAQLQTRGMDPRTKADLLFARIKHLRFPGQARFLNGFEETRKNILRDAKELRLEPVQGFETPGFELHARVKTPEELDRVLQTLSMKRSLLNSLFEIAL